RWSGSSSTTRIVFVRIVVCAPGAQWVAAASRRRGSRPPGGAWNRPGGSCTDWRVWNVYGLDGGVGLDGPRGAGPPHLLWRLAPGLSGSVRNRHIQPIRSRTMTEPTPRPAVAVLSYLHLPPHTPRCPGIIC